MQITQRQLFLKHVAQTSSAPMAIEVERAEGIHIFDTSGKKYIDLISGISVSNIGHRHPAVLSAVKDQLEQYLHVMVYGEYIQSPQVKLAEKLSSCLPGINSFYFVNSGAEATEGAIKLARRYTGRKELISFRNAYHGSTTGALSLMSDSFFREAFEPLLEPVNFIDSENFNDLEKITEKTAAVFFEFVRGEGGAIPVSAKFASALRQRCTEKGVLLIADEIQTGFGRTGKLFAFQHHNIQPDILLMAKGMGGGMPIGAFAASGKLMNTLTENPVLGHITTFGGNPVCCAASLATLNTILSLSIEDRVNELESIVRSELKHPLIKGISGQGMLLAAEFASEEINRKVISYCLEAELITDWFLFAPQKMRIAPPLTISAEELRLSCRIITEACNKYEEQV